MRHAHIFSPAVRQLIDEEIQNKDSLNRAWRDEKCAGNAVDPRSAVVCEKVMAPDTNPSPSVSGGVRERFAPAYRVLGAAVEARAFPGCAFGVLANGRIMLQDGLGHFTYDDREPRVTAQTIFDVASLTKVAATTAAAMLLWQRGKLDLDSRVSELLPGFAADRSAGDPARRVTLRHLLAHSSGLPGYVEFFRSDSTPEALLQECLRLKLEAEPGTRAEYSDPGFILLGKALEGLAGEGLAAWTRREIFEPIGMQATGFLPAEGARLAIPPTEEDGKLRHRRIQGEVQDENAWVLGGAAGHAGLFSNVPDLLRLADAILHAGMAGAPKGAPLFDRKTVEFFAERQEPEGSSRALGWDTPSEGSSSGKHFSKHSIGHLGFSGCSLWIDLQDDIAVVLLTNRTWPDRKSQRIREVRPAFHNAIREAL
jgi:CubicO group peptidase (beta-lactamase class C family)